MIQISTIVYATDFSDLSACALDYAVYLAGQCQAKLHCIYVVDDSYQYWMPFDVSAVPAAPPVQDLTAAAQKQLGEFLKERLPAGTEAVSKVLHGQPFVEIIRYARDHQAGLIVLGTHGRGALRHVLMGSVAEKVVRKSPCPVLTVRDPEHEFELP